MLPVQAGSPKYASCVGTSPSRVRPRAKALVANRADSATESTFVTATDGVRTGCPARIRVRVRQEIAPSGHTATVRHLARTKLASGIVFVVLFALCVHVPTDAILRGKLIEKQATVESREQVWQLSSGRPRCTFPLGDCGSWINEDGTTGVSAGPWPSIAWLPDMSTNGGTSEETVEAITTDGFPVKSILRPTTSMHARSHGTCTSCLHLSRTACAAEASMAVESRVNRRLASWTGRQGSQCTTTPASRALARGNLRRCASSSS